MKQHTPEWFAARLGRATASRASDWMATLKTGGVPAVRKQYGAQLIRERLNGVPAETYQSVAMLTGIEREPEARKAYAFYANTDVVEVGFIPHPTITMAGASPDGLVGNDGLLEIKCPTDATHLETLLRPENIEGTYIMQMQFQMACTGRAWCDFVSYDPGWPEPMRLSKIMRVLRNDAAIELLEKEVQKFLAEVDATEQTLREKYELPQRAACPPSEPSTPTGRRVEDSPRNDAGAVLLLQQ